MTTQESPLPSYSHPAKNTIRDHWTQFVVHGLDAKRLRHIRIWFLPGPDTLELPAYQGMGIPTEHLQGFEWQKTRALRIRERCPCLPLYAGSLQKALAERPGVILTSPDWAHLDFDGSAFSFDNEVTEVVRRMNLDISPCLGVSSIATRDPARILRSMNELSLWKGLFPHSLDQGIDLLRAGNERLGLVLQEPSATYAICRELAWLFHILYAFGSRSYGPNDARAAETFRHDISHLRTRVHQELDSKTKSILRTPAVIPMAAVEDIRSVFMKRKVPIRLENWSRFACQSHPWRKWRWAWHFRFAYSSTSVPLLAWAQRMLFQHPPLHVVDFTGAVVGDRKKGVCRLCSTSTEKDSP